MAKNNLNVLEITARQEEISIEEDVLMTVSDFNIQQGLVATAVEALELAETAYSQTKQRFIIGKIDLNTLTLSLNRQQDANKSYISALQNYWLSYYNCASSLCLTSIQILSCHRNSILKTESDKHPPATLVS